MQPQHKQPERQQQRSKMPPVQLYLSQMLRQMWKSHRPLQTMLVRAPISVHPLYEYTSVPPPPLSRERNLLTGMHHEYYNNDPHPWQAAVQPISMHSLCSQTLCQGCTMRAYEHAVHVSHLCRRRYSDDSRGHPGKE